MPTGLRAHPPPGPPPLRRRRAPHFFYVCVSRSPSHALEVTGDLDKEDRRVGGRGKTLGRGLRDGAAGSTSEDSTTEAPASGAAAAAPEGVALAGPSASPHLPVVGARNPVAVLGLAL